MTKKKLTGPVEKRLQVISGLLLSLEQQKSDLESHISILKSEVIKINDKYDFPESTGKSQTFENLRVTRPESGYSVDFKKFIEVFGWPVFRDCFVITGAEMDLSKWEALLAAELVQESRLAECLYKKNDLSPRVSVLK